MAPRAYWKGYLKLSLVSCPIALFPTTSERDKISFHQLNKKTGHRVKYRKVDAESGDEVDSADIIKGYEVGKGDYIELDPEELELSGRLDPFLDEFEVSPAKLAFNSGSRVAYSSISRARALSAGVFFDVGEPHRKNRRCRPQSSSAWVLAPDPVRRAAGPVARILSRFVTMPSSPILQAWWNTSGPS